MAAKKIGVGLAIAGVLLACNNNNNNKPSEGSSGAAGPAGSASSASTAKGGTIKLGQTMPYSGPASAYATIGKTEQAYFKMVNEKGGVHGRKIELVSLDDAYNAAKTVELTRKLVESENIVADYGSIGSACQGAVWNYLNEKKIPQIFVGSGSDKWAEGGSHPWTLGLQPSYRQEGKIFAKHIKETKPNAKACALFQNDDFGKDYVNGLKDVYAGDFDKTFIKQVSYESTDPTVDSQVVSLQGSGCDTIVLGASPKFAAQAIRKIFDLGWKPTTYMSDVSVSINAVLKVAGLDKATGVISASYLKDPSDPKYAEDKGVKDFKEFAAKYVPDLEATDSNVIYGYASALVMTRVLDQCGDDVSPANIMKQSLSIDNFQVPMALDGITISTSDKHRYPYAKEQLAKFNGKSWELFGNILSAD